MGGDSFRRLLDGASVGLAEVDSRGVIVYANARLLAMSGRADLAGLALRDLIHEADRHALDEPHPVDVRIGDTWVSVEVTNEGVAAFTEVTERKRFEQHAQKMEAVGRLVGGVAHDFNNILTVIQSYATVLMRRRDLEERAQADISQIIAASERAGTLTRQLLAFSRRQVLEPEVVDVNKVVDDARLLLFRLLGEDIEVRVHLSRSIGRVFVDAGGLGQVIMNLAVNARDAMPDGGVLTITTENVVIDEHTARESQLRTGPHVRISVSDTGTGIDAATRARIFEPFFTTKAIGEGTGLGLSTALGIVQQSGGAIVVESDAGAGATFRIYLPWTERVAVGTGPPPNVRVGGGSETVLLVEDDPGVRELVTDILEDDGYRVLSAATPADALAIARDTSVAAIDLVLSDVVMPGMSGVDMWTKLRELRHDLRVLWISGYTEDNMRRHGLDIAGPFFLRKPFTPDELSARVRAALDA